MAALGTYRSQVQRLLHDANNNFYSQPDIDDYINRARRYVARESGCLRTLQAGLTLPSGQETYVPQTFLPLGARTVDVLGITIYWGNSRIKLRYYDFTRFDMLMRPWTNYQRQPVAFSRYGGNTIYIGPVPDQNYVSDWDTVLDSSDLPSDDSGTETMPIPFQTPVQFMAARLAKYNEQSMGESDKFMEHYKMEMRMAMASWMRRTIEDPYR